VIAVTALVLQAKHNVCIAHGAISPPNLKEKIMSSIRNGIVGALGFAIIVLPTAASAEFQYTAEQKSACMGDAIKLCSSVLFSPDRIFSCLMSKKPGLSPRCRAVAEKL
jgi:hypothetical protein